jgi:hypothetical protein
MLERLSKEYVSLFFCTVCIQHTDQNVSCYRLTPYLLCPSTHVALLPALSRRGQYLVYFLLFDFSVTHIRSAKKRNTPHKISAMYNIRTARHCIEYDLG